MTNKKGDNSMKIEKCFVIALFGFILFFIFSCENENNEIIDENIPTWITVDNNIFGNEWLNAVYDIAWGNGKFVAVGYGLNSHIAYSSNGITWTAVNDSIFDQWNGIRCITWGDGKFIVGAGNKMAYSYDGISWNNINNTTFDDNINGILTLAWGNGKFIAGGSKNFGIQNNTQLYGAHLAYSSDGITWDAVIDNTFSDL